MFIVDMEYVSAATLRELSFRGTVIQHQSMCTSRHNKGEQHLMERMRRLPELPLVDVVLYMRPDAIISPLVDLKNYQNRSRITFLTNAQTPRGKWGGAITYNDIDQAIVGSYNAMSTYISEFPSCSTSLMTEDERFTISKHTAFRPKRGAPRYALIHCMLKCLPETTFDEVVCVTLQRDMIKVK